MVWASLNWHQIFSLRASSPFGGYREKYTRERHARGDATLAASPLARAFSRGSLRCQIFAQWINHYPVDNAISFRNTHPFGKRFIRWIAVSNFWTTGARIRQPALCNLFVRLCTLLLSKHVISFNLQLYLLQFSVRWRMLLARSSLVLLLLCIYWLRGLRNIWQILFHVAVASLVLYQTSKRQLQEKPADYNVWKN